MGDTQKTIGIIGFGNMGSAIAERIKTKYQVFVFDKDETKTKNIKGIKLADNSEDLVNKVDTVILAVKPQDFDIILNEIKGRVKDKLVISIAAGINTRYIQKILGNVRIIRVMPNLLAKIGESLTFLYKGLVATKEDVDFAKTLFDHLGKTWLIEENMMNAATAVSGTGPACCCDFMDSRNLDYHHIPAAQKKELISDLSNAAEAVGFNQENAKILATLVVNGVIDLFDKTNLTPLELRKQITSRGGTTEAALEVLHRGGSMTDALKAAVKRARELSGR